VSAFAISQQHLSQVSLKSVKRTNAMSRYSCYQMKGKSKSISSRPT